MTTVDSLEQLDKKIRNIIQYLHQQQRPDGEFPTLRQFPGEVPSYVTPTEFPDWYSFGSCPFATANIAYHLRYFDDSRVRELCCKACMFLLGGFENGVARYVPACSKPADFPTDVDDTCLAVAAIRANGISSPFNEAMVFDNTDLHGNFYTWLIPRWKHLRHPKNFQWLINDARECRVRMLGYGTPRARLQHIQKEYSVSSEPAIAANVLLCTRATRKTRVFLATLIDRFRRGDLPLQYYAHPLVPLFHVARLFESGVKEVAVLRGQIIHMVQERQATDGSVNGPFNSAIAALTLIFFDAWDQPCLPGLLKYICDQEMHEKGWLPLHYCNDLDGVFVDGGAELTAAFYLDVLVRYRRRLVSSSALQGTGMV